MSPSIPCTALLAAALAACAPAAEEAVGAASGPEAGSPAGEGTGAARQEDRGPHPAASDAATPRATGAPAADLRLRTRRSRTVEGKPEWMLATDLDGDGDEEVLVTTNSPGELLLWRERAAEPERHPVGDYPLRPVRLGSAVAVASRADRSLVWLDLSTPGEARELGRFELPDVPMALAAGTLDAAAGPELVVATRHGRLLRLSPEGLRGEAEVEGRMPRCAAVLGPELGLVVGFQSGHALEGFRLEDGALRPRGLHRLPGPPRDLLVHDLDGDGEPELVVVEGDHGGRVLGLGGEDPLDPGLEPLVFATAAVPVRALPLRGLAGRELATLASKSVALELWRSDPDGLTRVDLTLAGQSPADFVALEGAAGTELWVANRDAHRITTLRTDERGPVEPAKVEVGAFPNDIATGDLDGDGLPEAFVVDAKDLSISVLRRPPGGGGPPLRRVGALPTGPSPRGVHCADADGDGARDLLWIERVAQGTRLAVRLGDGRGGLREPADFAPVPLGVGATDLVVARFPGLDGPLVVAADPDGGRLRWLRLERVGEGLAARDAGELEVPGSPSCVELLRHRGQPRGVAIVTRDGVDRSSVRTYTLDLAPDGAVAWAPLGEAAVPGFALDLSAADLDGDGTDDLAALCADRENSVRCRVTPVLVRGRRHEALPSLLTGLRAFRALAADLSGDGRAELFAANLDSHDVSAWMDAAGEGAPRYRSLPEIGAGVGCIALAAPDLDGDGDLDLLVVDSANDGVSVILNDAPR
jgi:hypothetical protein